MLAALGGGVYIRFSHWPTAPTVKTQPPLARTAQTSNVASTTAPTNTPQLSPLVTSDMVKVSHELRELQGSRGYETGSDDVAVLLDVQNWPDVTAAVATELFLDFIFSGGAGQVFKSGSSVLGDAGYTSQYSDNYYKYGNTTNIQNVPPQAKASVGPYPACTLDTDGDGVKDSYIDTSGNPNNACTPGP